jgi:hypothetical protein
MPVAAFICPMIGTGTRADPYRAKYQHGDPSIVRAGQIRFGHTEDAVLLIEASQAYLDTISADPECAPVATAANINDQLTAQQVTNIQNFLEARGIPADWLTAGETRRQAIRGLCGMFLFSHRMEGLYGRSWKQKLVDHGVTLASQWQNLPGAFQQELIDTAHSWGWTDITGAQPTTTLRTILKAMGNRHQMTPIFIANFEV